MKKIIITLVLLLAGVAFITNGCNCGNDTSGTDGGRNSVITETPVATVAVRIGFPRKGLILNHYGETLSRTNILEKNSLAGSLSPVEDEMALRTAIINKSFDVAFISDFQAILTLGADFNGILIANLGSLGRSDLMVLPESPVQKISDLKGRKIGVTFNTAEHSLLLGWFRREGLQEGRDIELVNTNDNDKLGALQGFKIDALVATDPKVEEYQRKTPPYRSVYDSHNYSVVLMSKDFYKQQPKAAARFVNALKEATLFISTHKPDVNNWIKGYCGISEDLIWGVSSINIGYFSTRKINEAKIYLSDTFTGNLKNLAAYALQQKLIYKTLIISDLMAQELQDEAKKEIDPLKYDPAGVKAVK
ncbi:MAG: ABC transporter substrate-binding protein [Planctomycetes bacterium]|nr:ABC transporter substrate-binding protein [Planctomycetota bacterium]